MIGTSEVVEVTPTTGPGVADDRDNFDQWLGTQFYCQRRKMTIYRKSSRGP
jgi:hypothetical protein